VSLLKELARKHEYAWAEADDITVKQMLLDFGRELLEKFAEECDRRYEVHDKSAMFWQQGEHENEFASQRCQSRAGEAYTIARRLREIAQGQ
jgi:hypothetical protein